MAKAKILTTRTGKPVINEAKPMGDKPAKENA